MIYRGGADFFAALAFRVAQPFTFFLKVGDFGAPIFDKSMKSDQEPVPAQILSEFRRPGSGRVEEHLPRGPDNIDHAVRIP